MSGKANDRNPRSRAIANAFLTLWRMLHSEERQNMLIPATWIIARNGSLPAFVSTAAPKAIGPWRASSRNGSSPDRRLIAPETPWGKSNQ